MIIKLIDRPEIKRFYDPFDFFSGEVPIFPAAIQYEDHIVDSDYLFYVKFTELEKVEFIIKVLDDSKKKNYPTWMIVNIVALIRKHGLVINLNELNKNKVKFKIIN